jgi:hypothetical protein
VRKRYQFARGQTIANRVNWRGRKGSCHLVQRLSNKFSLPSFFLTVCSPKSTFHAHSRLFTMSTWVPQPAGLQEILQTIRDSIDTQSNVQRAITHVWLLLSIILSVLTMPSSEIELFYTCTRLYCISGIHLDRSLSRRRPSSDDSRVSIEKQLPSTPYCLSGGSRIHEVRRSSGLCQLPSFDQECCWS